MRSIIAAIIGKHNPKTGGEDLVVYTPKRRVTRYSCFETNSSSQHSVLITKNDAHVTPEEIADDDYDNPEYIFIGKDGQWRLRGIEDGYGRYPLIFLSTFEDKMKYAICAYLGDMWGDEENYNDIWAEFDKIAADIIPDFRGFDIYKRDVDIYLDEEGNEIPRSQLKYNGYDNDKDESVYTYKDKDGNEKFAVLSVFVNEVPAVGMIDHQSAGLLQAFLKEEGISLKEFLTNKKYIVVVTGDEFDDLQKLFVSGVIDSDFVTRNWRFRDTEWFKKWKESNTSSI